MERTNCQVHRRYTTKVFILPLLARKVRSTGDIDAENAAAVERLAAALINPSVTDVVLLSECDGKEIPAVAFLLTSCRPVFLKLLTALSWRAF